VESLVEGWFFQYHLVCLPCVKIGNRKKFKGKAGLQNVNAEKPSDWFGSSRYVSVPSSKCPKKSDDNN
jgi:hypothetical protein